MTKSKATAKAGAKAKAKAEADLLGELPDVEWRGFIQEASKSATGITSDRAEMNRQKVMKDEIMDVEIHSGFGVLEKVDAAVERRLQANPDLSIGMRVEEVGE